MTPTGVAESYISRSTPTNFGNSVPVNLAQKTQLFLEVLHATGTGPSHTCRHSAGGRILVKSTDSPNGDVRNH